MGSQHTDSLGYPAYPSRKRALNLFLYSRSPNVCVFDLSELRPWYYSSSPFTRTIALLLVPRYWTNAASSSYSMDGECQTDMCRVVTTDNMVLGAKYTGLWGQL